MWSHLQHEFKTQAANQFATNIGREEIICTKIGEEIIDYVTRARELSTALLNVGEPIEEEEEEDYICPAQRA
jgi:hypothetical protein